MVQQADPTSIARDEAASNDDEQLAAGEPLPASSDDLLAVNDEERGEEAAETNEVEVAEVAAAAAHHRLLIKSEADLPLEKRTFGPLLIWSGPQGQIPFLLFRPTRYSLEELHEELPRKPGSPPWHLSVAFHRTEVKLLQTILEDHGFSAQPSRSSNLLWCGSHVTPALLLGLGEFQKVNHFPRIHDITRKDLMARTLDVMRQTHGAAEYDFVPTTFVIPADTERLVQLMGKERYLSSWIVKPVASSRGRGISIIQQPHQLPQEDVVVSRYISNPLLIDGYKFDLRIYVAVTSFEPLRAYIFDEGLVRFSTEKYQYCGGASLRNMYMHLTNYSINKHSSRFVPNHDANEDDHGNKWSMSALRRCLARGGVDVEALFARIDALVLKTLIAVELPVVSACRRFCPRRNCCFELVGFDVLIDSTLKPWLLEVNMGPSLAVDSPLDLKVKTSMLCDLLTLVSLRAFDRSAQRKEKREKGQQRLERLARGEPTTKKRKPARAHQPFSETPAALRAIRELDEEGAKAGGWRRIYPVAHGAHYAHLFAVERQLNSMLCEVLAQRKIAEGHAPATARAPPLGAQSPTKPSTRRGGSGRRAPRSPGGVGFSQTYLKAIEPLESARKGEPSGASGQCEVRAETARPPPPEVTVEIYSGSWSAPSRSGSRDCDTRTADRQELARDCPSAPRASTAATFSVASSLEKGGQGDFPLVAALSAQPLQIKLGGQQVRDVIAECLRRLRRKLQGLPAPDSACRRRLKAIDDVLELSQRKHVLSAYQSTSPNRLRPRTASGHHGTYLNGSFATVSADGIVDRLSLVDRIFGNLGKAARSDRWDSAAQASTRLLSGMSDRQLLCSLAQSAALATPELQLDALSARVVSSILHGDFGGEFIARPHSAAVSGAATKVYGGAQNVQQGGFGHAADRNYHVRQSTSPYRSHLRPGNDARIFTTAVPLSRSGMPYRSSSAPRSRPYAVSLEPVSQHRLMDAAYGL
ncbi:hypothetical protein AB1Y20_000280 [Prymnesium parvum]|uniref:Tubulin--tyrosine ligase-like protein 5 n=1 Tax=Prymnesium parvum TaxID=97485 RepID=A0AB34K4W8_PRYPA